MENNFSLTGRIVLVHPELYDDPAGKTGKTGSIRSAVVGRDDFIVDFPDGKMGLYAANALMVLRAPAEIHRQLDNDKGQLLLSQRLLLYKMALIQTHGYPEQVPAALERAKNSPVIRDLALVTLEDKLGIQKARMPSR